MTYRLGFLSQAFATLLGFSLIFSENSLSYQLQAGEATLQEKISFGNLSSTTEAYLFTDWKCPSCYKLEGKLDDIVQVITQKSRLIFVDLPVHPETMNFTPYNLSFMVNHQDKYLHLRKAIYNLAQQTDSPTEEQIESIAKANHIQYKPTRYTDVAKAFKFYSELAQRFKVTSTPSLVLVNTSTKKGKKLKGGSEITKAKVIEAMSAIQ